MDPDSFRLRYPCDMVLNTVTYTMYILANKLHSKENSMPSSLVVAFFLSGMGAIANLPSFKLTISAQANHMAFHSWSARP
jgi:hypothetical protein